MARPRMVNGVVTAARSEDHLHAVDGAEGCVDIEDGFGGPLAVYRSVRRMVAAGATALQLEDSSDMEESTKLLPRERYYEKVKAALDRG